MRPPRTVDASIYGFPLLLEELTGVRMGFYVSDELREPVRAACIAYEECSYLDPSFRVLVIEPSDRFQEIASIAACGRAQDRDYGVATDIVLHYREKVDPAKRLRLVTKVLNRLRELLAEADPTKALTSGMMVTQTTFPDDEQEAVATSQR